MPLRFSPAQGASVLLSSSSRGPAGASATVAVGTTTTGAQGTSASVSNSGSASTATFNFTIPRGAVPAVGWNFDSTTTDADPGSGDFRLNHATYASATAAYFDNNERGGTSVTTFLDAWDDSGDSTTRGFLLIFSAATPTTFHLYRVSGSVTDGTGYRKITIASLGGSGTFTEGEHVAVQFLPAGPSASSNSFETIATPAGTSPVADTSTDTLTIAQPAAGLTITGDSSSDTITFALANDLAALEAMASTGLVARTASETYAQRTLTAPAAGITVSDGNGVAGNPTLALANDLAALEAMASTGIVTRTASETYAQRTITGTSNLITVTDGDGVAGNPTLTVGSNVMRKDGDNTLASGIAILHTQTSNTALSGGVEAFSPALADGEFQTVAITGAGTKTINMPASDTGSMTLVLNNTSGSACTLAVAINGNTTMKRVGAAVTSIANNGYVMMEFRRFSTSGLIVYQMATLA